MDNVVGQPQTVQVPNYSGVNIQIFNPTVNPPGANVAPATINAPTYSTAPAQSYPPNYYTQNLAQPVAPASAPAEEKKKTEKREIVQITDEYLKTVEGYLNDQNQQVRLMGAKDVMERLQEDDSRKDDPALNSLVNKMLQDPYQPIRFIAMAALESRAAQGNDLSRNILQSIQKEKTSYGEDSLKASNILLKMSGPTVKKEFEVKDTPKKEKSKGEK